MPIIFSRWKWNNKQFGRIELMLKTDWAFIPKCLVAPISPIYCTYNRSTIVKRKIIWSHIVIILYFMICIELQWNIKYTILSWTVEQGKRCLILTLNLMHLCISLVNYTFGLMFCVLGMYCMEFTNFPLLK